MNQNKKKLQELMDSFDKKVQYIISLDGNSLAPQKTSGWISDLKNEVAQLKRIIEDQQSVESLRTCQPIIDQVEKIEKKLQTIVQENQKENKHGFEKTQLLDSIRPKNNKLVISLFARIKDDHENVEEMKIKTKELTQSLEKLRVEVQERKKKQTELEDRISELEKSEKEAKIRFAQAVVGDLALSTKNLLQALGKVEISSAQAIQGMVHAENPELQKRATEAKLGESRVSKTLFDALDYLTYVRMWNAHPTLYQTDIDEAAINRYLSVLEDPSIIESVKLILKLWEQLDFKTWVGFNTITYFKHKWWKKKKTRSSSL